MGTRRIARSARLRRRLTLAALIALVVSGVAVGPTAAAVVAPGSTTIRPSDWPSYGHDPQHSFVGVTSLTPTSATQLSQAWFFSTGDAVVADPIVVGNTVYFGSWDGYFYAVNRKTGALRWKYQVAEQTAINPSPGNTSTRNPESDGGLINDAAWFQPASGNLPNLVIFGSGFTLYALNADTGALFWSQDYTGLPESPPSPTTDTTRIFSSPTVYENQVIFGVDTDGEAGHRGYVASASLKTGKLKWRFETDVNEEGQIQNDGCGGVWSSPALDPVRGLVYVGVSDCNNQGIPPYNERVLALHALTGQLAWVFTPPRLVGVPAGTDPACDFDFGASVNLGSPNPRTKAFRFLGVGAKDGTYYSIDPGSGALDWDTNVVFGGSAGGFIGTAAYNGSQIFASTAIGDFGGEPCEPGNPADTPEQEPSMDAFNSDGTIAWQEEAAQNFGPTTFAGGMTFDGYVFAPEVQVRNASTGMLITTLPATSDCFCGVTVSGNAVFFGTGSPQQGTGDGVYAFTPSGVAPTNN